MIWAYYPIFVLADFLATGLVARTYTIFLTDIGPKDILVTRGNLVSITYEGVMLSIDLNGQNPFEMDGYRVVKGTDGIVYLGVPDAS